MQRGVIALFGWVGAALVAGVVAPRPARAGEKATDETTVASARQSLVGEWQFNKTLSDDPRAKMSEGRRRAGGGPPDGGPVGGPPGGGTGGWGGRPPAGGPGPGGWGGRSGGGRPGPGRGGPGGPSGGMVLEAQRITITNLTPEITMVTPEGGLRTLHADGKGYRTSSGGTVKTRWKGVELMVETKGDGGSVKESWSVSAPPLRLTVLLELQRPFGGTVKILRVFDPRPPDGGEPEVSRPVLRSSP